MSPSRYNGQDISASPTPHSDSDALGPDGQWQSLINALGAKYSPMDMVQACLWRETGLSLRYIQSIPSRSTVGSTLGETSRVHGLTSS